MVSGRGLIASAFSSYLENNNFVIFASGVSNSQENRLEQFKRERNLLQEVSIKNLDKTLVYFSTCAFYDNYFMETPYVNHKKNTEKWIQNNIKSYYIFRVPQIIGSKNKNQLLGFLNDQISKNLKFKLFDIERNLIDLDFLFNVVDHVLKNNLFQNDIINISYPQNISVLEIVEILEKTHSKKANYELIKKKGSFIIDNSKLIEIYDELGLIIHNFYFKKIKSHYE